MDGQEQKVMAIPCCPETDDPAAWQAYRDEWNKYAAALQSEISDVQKIPGWDDYCNNWNNHWKKLGCEWRTEPEIDVERQSCLNQRRATMPSIEHCTYPFKDIELKRADIEWLLATHENGKGPVKWEKIEQRGRDGLDLRGANLRSVKLSGLPLANMRGGLTAKDWQNATDTQRDAAVVHLEGAYLRNAHLEGALLRFAHLQGAYLRDAHLENTYLRYTHFEGATLKYAHLEGANLGGAFLDSSSSLDGATVSNEQGESILIRGVHWGNVDVSVVDWMPVKVLGDEIKAKQRKDNDGEVKNRDKRLKDYRNAARAYRQLAIALQAQGLNDDAARFAYRAQLMQRAVLWRERQFGSYLFSAVLALFAGYGYKPVRCIYVYVATLAVFALAHYLVGMMDGSHLTLLNALAITVQNLHGRNFSLQTSDPQTLLNTAEAFVGLFIEAIIVAVITQRILGGK